MANIELKRFIDESKLNERYYFKSLTEYLFRCGILTQENAMRLQSELLSLLAAQSESFTNGKSSSLPKEKAQEIADSVVFTIGLFLKSQSTADEAAKALISTSVKQMFNEGLEIITNKMVIAHRIQKKIVGNLLSTPNIYYRSTIIDGINGFFKLYTPQFAAHEIHITADYPTLADRPELDGIEFIEKYLRNIEAENLFCKFFDENDIDRLMRSMSIGYEHCPINILEPVLLSSLGLIIVGKYPKFLDLTVSDTERLSDLFKGLQKTQISNILENAFAELQRLENIPHKSVGYISEHLPKLSATIKNAADINAVNKIFVVCN